MARPRRCGERGWTRGDAAALEVAAVGGAGEGMDLGAGARPVDATALLFLSPYLFGRGAGGRG